ncbi:hypothetical protein BV25DRAFT_1920556 [Artomyces pyxidatus]|uniref:Uncharacterized protein n=1 Tax=Artomyces pyxidatus TaxID=48021 RepID=A0ACB8SKC9_9AGAM|nr:hypothetical protein BV25DRAFT_1920556 [Artomyces pyxidatus]
MPLSAQNEALYQSVRQSLFDTLFVAVFYGAFFVLMIGSMYILFRINRRAIQTIPRITMVSAIGLMFSCASIAFILQIPLFLGQLPSFIDPLHAGSPWSHRKTNVITSVGAVSVRINYILSDAIVVWRALTLWSSDRRVLFILLIFMLGTIAAAGSDLGLSLSQLFDTHDVVEDQSNAKQGRRALILVGPTLATNVCATLLIAYKAWSYRVFVKAHLNEDSAATKVEKIFALLVESGVAYCVMWILYILAAFRVFPGPGPSIMDGIMVQISGIYPTIIIILVCLQKSPVEKYATQELDRSLSFAAAPWGTNPGVSTGISVMQARVTTSGSYVITRQTPALPDEKGVDEEPQVQGSMSY